MIFDTSPLVAIRAQEPDSEAKFKPGWRPLPKSREALTRGHCFAYALATISGEPLLYKGDEFGKTDVISAL